MVQRRVRIGAVHALANAIPTTQAAFDAGWAEADVAHLLDGSLYLDRNSGTADDSELASRIDRLVRYSEGTGAEGIIVTGSFFGDAASTAGRRAQLEATQPGYEHHSVDIRDQAGVGNIFQR